MDNGFDLLSNLPLLFFGFCFLIDFVLFIWAGITLLKAEGKIQKIEKGRKLLSNAFVVLFLILLVMIVFYSISYLLKKGKVFQPTPEASGEFPPPLHIEVFPPAPEFIDIGKYYFTGPWPLSADQRIVNTAISAVLCKKNGEYDILYIGDATGDKLMRHGQYSCWLENCNKSTKNLYIAIFWTPLEKYDAIKTEEIKIELNNQINPPCKR